MADDFEKLQVKIDKLEKTVADLKASIDTYFPLKISELSESVKEIKAQYQSLRREVRNMPKQTKRLMEMR